jgi:hypothetical protein
MDPVFIVVKIFAMQLRRARRLSFERTMCQVVSLLFVALSIKSRAFEY